MTKQTGRFMGRATGTGRGGRLGTFDRRDEAGYGGPKPGAERKYDRGNRQFILSLPPGEYEAEDDADAGMMHIRRVGNARGDEEAEFVCTVPSGSYQVENDKGGAHLYRLPADENPIESLPVAGENNDPHGRDDRRGRDDSWRRGSKSLPARLRAMNAKHREHYRPKDDDDDKGRPRVTADERRQLDMFLTRGIVAGSLADEGGVTMVNRLKAMNALNKARYGSQKGGL
jgi:hypothetical protein